MKQVAEIESQAAAERAAAERSARADAARSLVDQLETTQRLQGTVLALRGDVEGSMLAIRASMPGWNALANASERVAQARSALALAGDYEERVLRGGELRSAIEARYQAELQGIERTRQAQQAARTEEVRRLAELAQGYAALSGARDSLLLSSQSPLTHRERFDEAGRQFEALAARARAGDPEAVRQLGQAANAYASENQAYYGSSPEGVATFSRISQALAALGALAGDAQAQADRVAAGTDEALGEMTELQSRTLEELEGLRTLTEGWSDDLGERMREQAISWSSLGLSVEEQTEVLRGLPRQIFEALDAALRARDQAFVAAAAAAGAASGREVADAVNRRADAVTRS